MRIIINKRFYTQKLTDFFCFEKNNKRAIWISFFVICFAIPNCYAIVNDYDKPVDHPPIPILDEQGKHVLETKNPYSPKKSCEGSGCHDYEAITRAYHFEMGRDETSDHYGEKRGLPHLVSPGKYGGYSCMGGSNPQVLAKKNNANPADFADYGSAGWVKTCMDCHQGGGWAEKDRHGLRYDQKEASLITPLDGDYYERVINPQTGEETFEQWDWKKSGVAEADCLICHIKLSKLKTPEDSGLAEALPPRKARNVMAKQGFFRQAATGLLENVLNTSGKHLVTIARSEGQLSLNDKGLPVFNWHKEAFDENGRATISMIRFPDTDNCMTCHLTSNVRRGFYGFGEDAAATLATEGDSEEPGAGGTLEDDYRDDVHKGTNFKANNGEQRAIENCNACHSRQYYKAKSANIDLDANHDFPKGNSDMDVRNDLDYSPNLQSCEYCHIDAVNAVVQTKYESLLTSHVGLWKDSGELQGYDDSSLSKIAQKHFDVVACQSCHIVDKKDSVGNDFQIMYRYRLAEDGKSKIYPYNPRLRYYWKDMTSGRVLVQSERNSIFSPATDAAGAAYGKIVDPISNIELGRVSIANGGKFGDPDSYDSFKAVKTAYDSLLRKKGYSNSNVSLIWTESNEYVISHNTRPAENSIPCTGCHLRDPAGKVSQQLSNDGVLGASNNKVITTIPDNRLISEGIITLGLPYNKLQENGDITQNVADILYETKIDPFMSLLKNSSANEITGKFKKVLTEDMLNAVGSTLGKLLAPDFTGINSFFFSVNKGAVSLRNMVSAITGSNANDILFPGLWVKSGVLEETTNKAVQMMLDERDYGRQRSRVFYFDVLDANKSSIASFNDSIMYMKVAYKGTQTDLNKINIVMADRALTRIYVLPVSDLVMIQPADEIDDGFVIFKMRESGYFVVADK